MAITNFHDVRFPTRLAFGARGGPRHSTQITVTGSGSEKRNKNWSLPRSVYEFDTIGWKRPEIETLIVFFRARDGRFYSFRFKDCADFDATGQGIGTGDGATTAFQLIKTYADPINPMTRTITKPVAGTVKVYLDAAEQASGWSVDTTTGIVTFDDAPGPGVAVTADFEFDVPVRFEADELPVTLEGPDVYIARGLSLVEVRDE